MNLKESSLKLRNRGKDVTLLQDKLRQLSFTIKDKVGNFGTDTRDAVKAFQKKHGIPATGVVDEPTAKLINKAVDALKEKPEAFRVSGRIVQPDGNPLVNKTVKALDQEIGEKELGTATTDNKGFYKIIYKASDLSGGKKERANLVVKVFDNPNDKKPAAVSPLILHALPDETINLVVGDAPYRGEPKFKVYERTLNAALNGADLDTLTEKEVAVLADKTNLPATDIAYHIKVKKLEKQTKGNIPAEVFYGLIRNNLPTSLPALLTQDKEVLKSALKSAVNENVIDPAYEKKIDDMVAKLEDQTVETFLADDAPPENQPALLKMLETAGLTQKQKKVFLTTYVKNDNPMPEFWKALRNTPEFRDNKVKELQFTIQLGTATLNHPPLVKILQKHGDVKTIRDLAKFDKTAWMKLLTDNAIDAPEGIPGKTKSEKQEKYAETIIKIVEDSFPTAVLAHKLVNDADFANSDFSTFFATNPEFEFRGTTIAAFLAKNPNALDSINDKKTFRSELDAAHRIFRLTPNTNKFDTFKVLWKDKLHSAYDIKRMGNGFISKYEKKLGGRDIARKIYNRAGKLSALALMTIAKYSSVFNSGNIPVINNNKFSNDNILALETDSKAKLKTMFGSLDFCDCKHCRSVLSRAAYLVDTLEYLREMEANNGKTGLQILFDRRPDIGELELSCENTNTMVSYIDLVNEILENAVDGSQKFYQSKADPALLRANPEHINVAAYNKLKTEIYPWNLPFNLWWEEARVFLKHLGVPRFRIMERFRKAGNPPEDINIACEYFGITTAEREIIVGDYKSSTLYEYYGLNNANGLTNRLTFVTNWLKHTQLKYNELAELLKAEFVNPDHKKIKFPPDSCALNSATLKLNEDEKDKLHRFLRLQQKLGWSVIDLDRALTALNPGDIDDDFIIKLAEIKRLQMRFNIPLAQMLIWWSPINTTEYPKEGKDDTEKTSFYDDIFLNIAVNNLHGGTPNVEDVFKLNQDRNELADTGKTINAQDHMPLILAVINFSAEDLSRLIAEDLPDDKINLANLSHLYRVSSFTRALNISVSQYLSFKKLSRLSALTEVKPASTTTPGETRKFVECLDFIRKSGFTIETLDYVLRHQVSTDFTVTPGDENIQIFLENLRSELQKLLADNALEDDDKLLSLKNKLSLVLSDPNISTEELVTEALAIIDGSSGKSNTDQKQFIEDHLKTFLDVTDATKELVDPRNVADAEAAIDYVLPPLINHLMENLVKQNIADMQSVEVAIMEQLLKEFITIPNDPNRKAIAAFLDDGFITNMGNLQVTRQNFTNQYQTFEKLHKIAQVLQIFKTRSKDLAFLFEKGPGIGWLDFDALPISPINSPPAGRFEGLKRVIMAYELDKTIFNRDTSLFDLLGKAFDPNVIQIDMVNLLNKTTLWKQEDIVYLVGNQGFSFQFPSDYQNEKWLKHLRDAVEIIKRIGGSAEQIWSWNTPVVDLEQARAIKNVAKAKYDDKKWLEIASPLRDILREKQRNALQSCLIGNGGTFEDVYALYEHFLIDTEMSKCEKTSRILQASLSVQLFVQRIVMNLEADKGLTIDRFLASEWPWRRNYRVWEAARKVFLYPENWIEPELRDDKSPFFNELEDELLQDDINEQTVERAYLRYLRKLDEVARLEICGLYVDEEQDIIHVFGRTRANPHIYYYRRWEDKSVWTAWEKVDVDIEGDHLIPVVYNRRLYLFWPIFKEKVIEQTESDLSISYRNGNYTDNQNKLPQKYYEIGLAWSEFKDGNWSGKKITNVFITTQDVYTPFPRLSKFYFFSYINKNNELVIVPYAYWVQDGAHNTMILEHFVINACNENPEKKYAVKTSLYYIPNTYNRFMKYLGESQFSLFTTGSVDSDGFITSINNQIEILSDSIHNGTYKISYPHQYPTFIGQSPFFYEDMLRNFFIIPRRSISFVARGEDAITAVNLNEVRPEGSGTSDSVFQPGELAEVSETLSDLSRNSAKTVNPGYLDPHSSERFYSNTSSGLTIDRNRTNGNGLTDPDGIITNDFNTTGDIITDSPDDAPRTVRPQIGKKFLFKTFYHPYVCLFIKQLNRYGINGLLKPVPEGDGVELLRQLTPNNPFVFKDTYDPNPAAVIQPYPIEDIDFEYGTAYSTYNWELFFHIPLLVATRLSQNQKFEEAQKWFHYIFDPTETEGDVPRRFWKIKPFFEFDSKQTIQELMNLLNQGDEAIERQVDQWRKTPFSPHAVARLRMVAYMKTIVMKYIDNLIAWGDNEFRKDTRESINIATQLYILAAQILGRKPERVTRKDVQTQTYNQLLPDLDKFSIPRRAAEDVLIESVEEEGMIEEDNDINALNSILFFCIPNNNKILGYWDTVAERLFKIRHCMNIEGVVRQLPLFQPPIDPGLLVRAAAAGVDLSSALNDLNAPLPFYRFQYMLQRAIDFCNDVRSLGASLLSALEKRDAEELGLLRAGHEVELLKAIRQIKENSIDESQETLESLKNAKKLAEIRKQYYSTREYINASEKKNLAKLEEALWYQRGSQLLEVLAATQYNLPEAEAGTAGAFASPFLTLKFGGINLGNILQAASRGLNILAAEANHASTKASIIGGFDRRIEDWEFQSELAAKEIEQIDKQIAAANIRLAIAEKDLENQKLQIENSQEVKDFLRDKFTSVQLYNWMVTQISNVYFQSYQLAYDMAKRAEKAFQHELAIENTNFIQFGYWDSLKKGLLSGEQLHKDLKRMEFAYLEKNKREFELTKHVSLLMLDPQQLIQLRETGACDLELPEWRFDLDYPGHFMRRIKSVSMTVPCKTGPYTNVNCKLMLGSNRIRKTAQDAASPQYAFGGQGDQRFKENYGGVESIATSSAQNDSGLFELNFRDERYLPFEGAGTISNWHLEFPGIYRQFDYNSISDVIIHIRYTAREGGKTLEEEANKEVLNQVKGKGILQGFSARRDFSSEWYRFLHPAGNATAHNLELNLTNDRFPFMVSNETIELHESKLILKLKDEVSYDNNKPMKFDFKKDGGRSFTGKEFKVGNFDLPDVEVFTNRTEDPGKWILEVKEDNVLSLAPELRKKVQINGVDHDRLNPEAIEDIFVLLRYSIS